MPIFNEKLKEIIFTKNQIYKIKYINKNLRYLSGDDNNIFSIPKFHNLLLSLNNNNIYLLPYNDQSHKGYSPIYIKYNPIYDLFKNKYPNEVNDYTGGISRYCPELNNIIKIIHNFRLLYYSIKFKNKFNKWLYGKLREERI